MHDLRESLAHLIGLPVDVDAAVGRWGSSYLHGATTYSLMLTDLRLNGEVRPEIHHLWLRLGPTGSRRAAPHLNRVHQMRCALSAVIAPYSRDDGRLSHGLAMPSRVRLIGPQEEYVLSRRPEAVHSEDHGEREAQRIEAALFDRALKLQHEVLAPLRGRALPRHLRRALQRHARGELATAGELQEARLFLEGHTECD